jgi:hypothetical protein
MPVKRRGSQIDAHAIMDRMQEEARRQVLAEMCQARELAALAGREPELIQAELDRWKIEGRIFSVEHEGAEYFPSFAIDPGAAFQPYPAVAEVSRIFDAIGWKSPLGLASWFVGLNSFLDDRRPMDLLAENPEWVIDAARDEAAE